MIFFLLHKKEGRKIDIKRNLLVIKYSIIWCFL